MNTIPVGILLSLSVPPLAAPAATAPPITAWQNEILRAIREHDHLITVVVYKRSIIQSGAADSRKALQVYHAFVVCAEKGNIPEGARIFFVKPMDSPMDNQFNVKRDLIGEPHLYHVIGDVHGKLKNSINVLWDPLCFSKAQESIHTDFADLRQHHAEEVLQAMQSSRTSPKFILDERSWKLFERQMQSDAMHDQ